MAGPLPLILLSHGGMRAAPNLGDLVDATAFSAFAECKPKGAAILRSEGEEEALFQDGGARSRTEIQAQLAAMIEAAFRSRLQSGL